MWNQQSHPHGLGYSNTSTNRTPVYVYSSGGGLAAQQPNQPIYQPFPSSSGYSNRPSNPTPAYVYQDSGGGVLAAQQPNQPIYQQPFPGGSGATYPGATSHSSQRLPPQHSNSPSSSFCKKYTEQNACGCKSKEKYSWCGQPHPNTQEENQRCYDMRPAYRIHMKWRRTTVKKGNEYCDNKCRAKMTGWRCCTCRRFVKGYLDQMTNYKLVHKADDNSLHEFCSNCVVHFQNPQLTQSVDAPSKEKHFHFHANLGGLFGNLSLPFT